MYISIESRATIRGRCSIQRSAKKKKKVDAVFEIKNIINIPPFSLGKKHKDALFDDAINDLTKHHYATCVQYQKILDVLGFDPTIKHNIEDIPPMPVRLFKDYDLLSVEKSQIIKIFDTFAHYFGESSNVFF